MTAGVAGRPPIVVHAGDCRGVLPALSGAIAAGAEGFSSCVTDPPYHLASIVARFGKPAAAPAKSTGATGVYGRLSRDFHGREWDGGAVAFDPETWAAVSACLLPGAHLAAFSHATGYHRMATAIEAAGFEIRDQLLWLYGEGMPKSHRQKPPFDDWGTGLKPACEPIVLARKPLGERTIAANLARHGTGALNIEAARIGRRYPATVLHNGGGFLPDDAARFFYCAKASAADRAGSKHPTVKPLSLIRWLIGLITPPGGAVLDPFAGTGTTGQAARDLGFAATLIEREPDYVDDINRRLFAA